MASEIRQMRFAGVDPVPIQITIAEAADDDAVWMAAGLPSSVFIQTVRPYRLHQPAADTYELIMGPEGFGGVLLEALQWLARVAAAGIMAAAASDQLTAFVQQYLERQQPDWRFEELTEHAGAFINDRYQRAVDDASYLAGLERQRHEAGLAALMVEIQAWIGQRG